MLFSSLTFLVWFLPAVILIHLVLPAKARNPFLLLASLFFYAWGEIIFLPLIVSLLVANWFFGLMVNHQKNSVRRFWMAMTILVNIGFLVYFKYTKFIMGNVGLSAFAPEVVMPLGISFFTFQITSYVVDVYRRDIPVERSLVNVMTYTILFPQLIAGPIVLYSQVRNEMISRQITPSQLEKGMMVFITGLASKVLLANPIGALFQEIIAAPNPSSPALGLAAILAAFQVYFDFAGYSSMAIGMGHMLGFKFPQNFNHPFVARSVRDIWGRWHMTLGTWLREYIYIPLGGNRKGRLRTYINLFLVWFASGLWHGADWLWVSWLMWFFVLSLLERTRFGPFIDRHPRLGWLYTQTAFVLGIILISYSNFSDGFHHMKEMLSFRFSTDILYILSSNGLLILVAFLCCVPVVIKKAQQVLERMVSLRLLAMGLLLVLCLAALVNEAYNPFIYFRF